MHSFLSIHLSRRKIQTRKKLEIGRFRGQSVQQRICQLCKNDVESEIHFLFEWPLYDRSQFLQGTDLKNVQSNSERIKKCRSNYQKLTAKFIAQIWNEQQTLIAIYEMFLKCFCLVIVFS